MKIAETYLAEDEAVDAEAFVNRASSLMEVRPSVSVRPPPCLSGLPTRSNQLTMRPPIRPPRP